MFRTISRNFRCILSGFELVPRQLRFLRQCLTRGWADSDLWSLDLVLAKEIAPVSNASSKPFTATQCT